jgi:hypothetical protein
VLIDKTRQGNYEYSFAVIQYKNIKTLESYNFGIILKCQNGNTLTHIPTLNTKIDTCLDISEKSAIAYTIEHIENTIEHEGKIKSGHISDALSVSQYRVLTSALEPGKLLQSLVDEYITLKKLRVLEKSSSKSKYDKRNIIGTVVEYAKSHEIDNFIPHRHFKNLAYRPIDMSLIDKNENPYSIATVSSPHLEHFQDSFVTNIFTLQESLRNGSIKNMFLHIPVFDDIKDTQVEKNIGWAKEQAQHYKIKTLEDYRAEAVFEMLQCDI